MLGKTDTRKANAHILGFAVAAGASDAVPVAGVVAVPMVQAAMLRQLAKLHGMQWDRRIYAEFLGALGASTLVRTASLSASANSSSSYPATARLSARRQRQLQASPPPTPSARQPPTFWNAAGVAIR